MEVISVGTLEEPGHLDKVIMVEHRLGMLLVRVVAVLQPLEPLTWVMPVDLEVMVRPPTSQGHQ